MFRLAFFVEDKNLPKVLHALSGLVVNMEPPQPVVNASLKGGKLIQTSSATTKRGQMAEKLKSLGKGKEVTTKDLKAMMNALGGNTSSVNSELVNALVDDKVFKRKDRGVFAII